MLKTDDGEKWMFKLSSNFSIIYFLRSDGISSLILDGEDFRRLNYVMSWAFDGFINWQTPRKHPVIKDQLIQTMIIHFFLLKRLGISTYL